ncbi:NAD(P)-binding domain-containing protein, partial [Salinimicrobium sp. CDJ15-91]
MKVLVIGAGNMGLTYAEGMARSTFLSRRKLLVFDVSPDKIIQLKEMEMFDVYEKLEDALPGADVI